MYTNNNICIVLYLHYSFIIWCLLVLMSLLDAILSISKQRKIFHRDSSLVYVFLLYLLNPLTARPFLKCDYWRLTQANCKVLVYHFVENFILFLKGVLQDFCLWKALQHLQVRPINERKYTSSAIKGLTQSERDLFPARLASPSGFTALITFKF